MKLNEELTTYKNRLDGSEHQKANIKHELIQSVFLCFVVLLFNLRLVVCFVIDTFLDVIVVTSANSIVDIESRTDMGRKRLSKSSNH